MGFEVNFSPGCMFEGAGIRTVPHINLGGILYNGRVKMSLMEILGV